MTLARKLTIHVPPDRIVRLPDEVPTGDVDIEFVRAPHLPLPSRERLRAARTALAGSFPALAPLGDALLDPMTNAELADWYGSIDPTT